MEGQDKRKRGRPPWTEEQRRAYNETIAKRREERANEAEKRKAREEQQTNSSDIAPIEPAQKPRPKRGRGGTQNFPQSRGGFGETEQDKVLIRRLMTETLHSWRLPKVKSDEELAHRLDEFFYQCAEQGKIPTVEEMEMCTGYSHGGLGDIESGRNPGFSPETKNILKRAREFLKTFDAKLVVTGELNPIVYFFRSKNYYGMVDKQEISVTGGENKVAEMSDDELAKWYLEDGNTIEQTFPEDK